MTTKYKPLPAGVRFACLAISRRWQRTGTPAFATIEGIDGTLRANVQGAGPDGELVASPLSAGMLEQLAEDQRRRALRLLAKYGRTSNPNTARTAADAVMRSRQYRGQFAALMGDVPTEDDQVFRLVDGERGPRLAMECEA